MFRHLPLICWQSAFSLNAMHRCQPASLALIAEYVYQQKLIPRRISVDEIFAETRDILAE